MQKLLNDFPNNAHLFTVLLFPLCYYVMRELEEKLVNPWRNEREVFTDLLAQEWEENWKNGH